MCTQHGEAAQPLFWHLSSGWFSLMTNLSVPLPPLPTVALASRLPPEQCLQRANPSMSFPCFPGPVYRINPRFPQPPGPPRPNPCPLLQPCLLTSHLPSQFMGLFMSPAFSAPVLALPFAWHLLSGLGQVSCLHGRCIHQNTHTHTHRYYDTLINMHRHMHR